MEAFLEGVLPRLLPDHVHTILIPHEGKSDLERSIPRKLRAWRTPNTSFVVVRDQDSADCRSVKQRLLELCHDGGRPDTLVRIACRELEAYYLGAPETLTQVTGQHAWQRGALRKVLRAPDEVDRPSHLVMEHAPGFGKVSLARAMGRVIPLDQSRSTSFLTLLRGIRAVAASTMAP